MTSQVIDIKCPNCGASLDTGQKTCKFCKQPVVISTFSSVYDMPMPMLNKYAGAYRQALEESPDNRELNNSIAMCYLKLRLYDQALASFAKATEDNFDNSETFFYAAVCLLKGKKAFVTPRAEIDRIDQYLDAALMIEPKSLYHYFRAYIKYDFFGRKFFKTSPTWEEALATAKSAGVSSFDAQQLFAILGVECPEPLVL